MKVKEALRLTNSSFLSLGPVSLRGGEEALFDSVALFRERKGYYQMTGYTEFDPEIFDGQLSHLNDLEKSRALATFFKQSYNLNVGVGRNGEILLMKSIQLTAENDVPTSRLKLARSVDWKRLFEDVETDRITKNMMFWVEINDLSQENLPQARRVRYPLPRDLY